MLVTETLKTGILKSIDTSKECVNYVDSKYIKFIKFNITYRKIQAWKKIMLFLKKNRKPQKKKQS